jgi:hypothetical protein
MVPVLYLTAGAAAVGLAVGFGGGWKLRDLSANAALAELQAYHAQRESAWERAARESTDLQRQIETRRLQAAAKEVEDARTDAALDSKRATDLAAANRGLLDHVARLAAYADRPRGDPTAAAGSAPATGPGLVLAQLYRGADQEARDLAASYDAARRAGITCERVYDSLISSTH